MDGSGLPLEGNLFPIKPQLEIICCAPAFVEGVITTTTTSTTIITIATTTLGETSSTKETLVVFWDLLKKIQDFWKPKNCNSTCWAFFQLVFSSSTLDVNSSAFQQFEQLKCVICYPLAPIVGIQRNIINYRTKNGISIL
jgi:hypothetical protein